LQNEVDFTDVGSIAQ